ncbi:MAG: BACON domain-containing protein [Bacteroidales bacterium]|nr:BACON domain-containing protein [Bacteroidales bacterium]
MGKRLISAFGAVAAVAVVVACICLSSCEKYILPRLECDVDTIWAPVSGGLYDVTLSTNVKWMFDSNTIPEWVTIDVKNGESDYQDAIYPLKVEVGPNTAGEAREAVMVYSSATISKKLVVEQK